MRLIKPSFEIVEQEPGIEGIFKQIECAGRTCYHSQDKITPDSAREFVARMIKSGHGAMLEHGTVYLKDSYDVSAIGSWGRSIGRRYKENKYSVVNTDGGMDFCGIYVTTNLRVLVENNWSDDLNYIVEPTEFHKKRYTVRFICDRGVSHEFVRHRVMSFAQESTRYCNYSKDKFGNEITCIIPPWMDLESGTYDCYTFGPSIYDFEAHVLDKTSEIGCKKSYFGYENPLKCCFIRGLNDAEQCYFKLLDIWNDKIPDKRFKTGFRGNPWTPQQARAVLPNALKTELVVTGFKHDWEHFFELRCAENAHPQARELAIPLRDEFKKRGYI